jgi:hypothetical protein
MPTSLNLQLHARLPQHFYFRATALDLTKGVRLIKPFEAKSKFQFLPQRKHNTSPLKISWLMLFGEIITVYLENHMKPINTVCGKNALLLIVKAGVTYNYHWVLKG